MLIVLVRGKPRQALDECQSEPTLILRWVDRGVRGDIRQTLGELRQMSLDYSCSTQSPSGSFSPARIGTFKRFSKGVSGHEKRSL